MALSSRHLNYRGFPLVFLKKCYNIPKIQRSEDFTQLYTNAKGTYLVVATHYRALFVSAKIQVI